MVLDPAKVRVTAEHKHDWPLTCGAIDPTGRFVIAGGRDKSLVCLELGSGAKASLSAHDTWISGAVRVGGDLVVTADFAGRLVAWDCSGEKPEPRWNIMAHANTIHALATSADGALVATGDRDGTIRVWQASDGQRRHEISGLEHPVYGLAFHPDGRRLVSADRQPRKPRLQWWDFAAGQSLRSVDVPQLSAYRRVEDIEWGGIRSIVVSPDGRWLAASGSNEYSGPACTLLFEFESSDLKCKWTSTLKGFCYAAQFHSEGLLLTASGDIGKGEFRAWKVEADRTADANKTEPKIVAASSDALATLALKAPCLSLDLHPDGNRCVVMQMTGKGSYPDAGALTIVEWT